MTIEQKYETALKALKEVATETWTDIKNVRIFASRIHSELTEPEMEEVTVERWYCPECNYTATLKEFEQNDCCKNRVKLTGTYQRPKPEPKVVEFEGVIEHSPYIGFFVNVSRISNTGSIGKRVTVRVEG